MPKTNDTKKHIAMYIGALRKGGAERVMCNLAEYFYNEGYNVTIVTTYLDNEEYTVSGAMWKTDIGDEDHSDYVAEKVLNSQDELCTVYHIKDASAKGIRRVFSELMPVERKGRVYNLYARAKKLEHIWADIKPDLILSFIGKNNIMAIYTAKKLNIPVVASVRANPPMEYYTKTMSHVANILFPKAAGVVLQTYGAASFFSKKVQTKCHVLPNSISDEFVRKEEVSFDERTKTIVSVGRLDDNKNQRILIRAFGRLMDKYPDYRLMIVGDGDCRLEYEKEACRTPHVSRIVFTGSVGNVSDRIADARIFVLTSKEEGLPNALLEAMALGLVVISTNCPCGGPADIINDGENGILIPMGTNDEMTDSLTAALDRVMSDDDLAKSLSMKALLVREKYAPARISGLWKDYFETILATEKTHV